MRPEERGRGLGPCALRLICLFGFDELGLARIELTTFPDNAAMVRIAERVGFTRGRAALLHARARPPLRRDDDVAPAGRAALGGLRRTTASPSSASSARSTDAVMHVKIGVSDSV